MALPCTVLQREYEKFKEDSNGDTCVNVCGSVSIVSPGTAFHLDYSGTSTPGTPQTIATITGTKRLLLTLQTTYLNFAILRVKLNGSLIASQRFGAGQYNAIFTWNPGREIISGDSLVLEFEARSGSPASDFEIYLMGTNI